MTGDELVQLIPDEERDRLIKSRACRFVAPMLATLTENHFSSPEWVYERKLDGERCVARVQNGEAALWSRSHKTLSSTYPEIVDALEHLADADVLVDGEVVAFEGSVTSFSRLQKRMQIRDEDKARASSVAVYFYVFDMPWCAGYDTTKLSLRTRKNLLRRALRFDNRVRFTAHRNTDGEDFFAQACEKRWEGVIAKQADSPYVSKRSRNWLKFKCVNRQELVIGGYTDPQGSRAEFGALLVGYYEGGDLRYAGKVGTGFDDETLRRLGKRLRSLQRKSSPFVDPPKEAAHWISPTLVGEFGFTEWTGDGKLRHPRFLGLRNDKAADEIVRERPVPA